MKIQPNNPQPVAQVQRPQVAKADPDGDGDNDHGQVERGGTETPAPLPDGRGSTVNIHA